MLSKNGEAPINSNSKPENFNPAVLPMEFRPRIPYASDGKHTRHYLIPGKIFAAAQPFSITTIVGSSVALCLWDPVHRIGGANHFMLPEGPGDGPNPTRYGNVANPALLKRLLELGADRKTLEAKIFGGSLPKVNFGHEEGHLGDRNVQAVTHFLTEEGIRLVHSEVGGTQGRKVVFQTDDGQTWAEPL